MLHSKKIGGYYLNSEGTAVISKYAEISESDKADSFVEHENVDACILRVVGGKITAYKTREEFRAAQKE